MAGTTAARVYQDLRKEILIGTYPAGRSLREEEVAAALGVSRTPVREALRRLHAEGLVELLPNRGAQVASWDGTDMDDIFQMRALLEGYAARLAARAQHRPLDDLHSLCDLMEKRLQERGAAAYVDLSELNIEFHNTVHLLAGNKLLPGLLAGVVHLPLIRHTFQHYTVSELQRSLRQHRELVEAIGAGDGDWAEALMRSHVLGARASLHRRNAEQEAHDDP